VTGLPRLLVVVARLAPKKYGDHISHNVKGAGSSNFQPQILIQCSSAGDDDLYQLLLEFDLSLSHLDDAHEAYKASLSVPTPARKNSKAKTKDKPALVWKVVGRSQERFKAKAGRGHYTIEPAVSHPKKEKFYWARHFVDGKERSLVPRELPTADEAKALALHDYEQGARTSAPKRNPSP